VSYYVEYLNNLKMTFKKKMYKFINHDLKHIFVSGLKNLLKTQSFGQVVPITMFGPLAKNQFTFYCG
jgi:hypothetical protein